MKDDKGVTLAQKRSRRLGLGGFLIRLVIVALVAVTLVALVGGAAGAIYIQRTLPQTSGTVKASGLTSAVSIVRDTYGVPHITGANTHDVLFAQGYVTAQDRLFQLEFNRRVAQGRLAEMFGPGPDRSLVDADAFLRTLDMYSAARKELASLDSQTLDELRAYASGINAFVSTHGDTLPLEFTILGITPAAWQPLDSLAYGRVVAYSLDGTWNTKYARELVASKVSPDVVQQLFPSYPSSNPTLIPTHVGGLASARSATPSQPATQAGASNAAGGLGEISPDLLRGAATVRALIGNVFDGLGSNNWVVDGSMTATGKPLLANDPHLGIRMPSIWYEISLRGGGLDVIGFSFPGDPGVVIGHNGYIAWGVTNVDADNADLYKETLDPTGHPGQYQYDGAWLPLQTRQEAITIRGEAKVVTITVSSTQHGPLLNSVVGDIKTLSPLALKWTALQPGYTFKGFFQLDFARNWKEFDAAVSNISISQNFVYADTSGAIGYRMSGVLPIRSADNDLLPVNGATSAHEWQGYVAQTEMPSLYNPTNHMIVTANNQIVDDKSSVYVTTDWDYGYRARRITDLLHDTPKMQSADFQRVQADLYSVPASIIAPRLAAVGAGASGDAATAATILGTWDFTMTRESAAAAIYEVTAGNLLRETVEPLLGKEVYTTYRDNFSPSGLFTVLGALVSPTSDTFLTTKGPAASGVRSAAIVKALTDAMASLRRDQGPDPAKWRWGALHQAHFAHPLASVSPLNLLFDVAPVDRPGDSVTVNNGGSGGFSADGPTYEQRTVSSMRQIIDLSNFDESLWVTTTGASGQPWSAHYADLVPLWNQGKYQRMSFTIASQAHGAVNVLDLNPK